MWVGGIEVHAVSDGTFTASPQYFGEGVPADAHPEFFDQDGFAWLPIGCFLLRTGGQVVLVDAGLGPDQDELLEGMQLVGGQLLVGLEALGVAAAAVTDVVLTHLHTDHVGWLFDLDAKPTFANATILYGAGDWDHFVVGPGEMRPHIRRGFLENAAQYRSLVADTTIVAPGVAAVLAPGHTPGHLCVSITSGEHRLLFLGDAITCPIQLAEPSWHSFGDVDAERAEQTRQHLWRLLEHTPGVGAHFPTLRPGHATSSNKWRASEQ